jgi:hypothetical protein
MIIKVWNNYDLGVYRINPLARKSLKKDMAKRFTPAVLKKIKAIVKEFMEQLGVEFKHNLKRGWENKLLAVGKVLTKNGNHLTTKEEIGQALLNDGEIQFFHHQKKSLSFITTILKSPHLCWR